jgi:hypothetical protein
MDRQNITDGAGQIEQDRQTEQTDSKEDRRIETRQADINKAGWIGQTEQGRD